MLVNKIRLDFVKIYVLQDVLRKHFQNIFSRKVVIYFAHHNEQVLRRMQFFE